MKEISVKAEGQRVPHLSTEDSESYQYKLGPSSSGNWPNFNQKLLKAAHLSIEDSESQRSKSGPFSSGNWPEINQKLLKAAHLSTEDSESQRSNSGPFSSGNWPEINQKLLAAVHLSTKNFSSCQRQQLSADAGGQLSSSRGPLSETAVISRRKWTVAPVAEDLDEIVF